MEELAGDKSTEATIIINEAGICQPLKPIGEMLKELKPKNKGKRRKRN